MKIKYMNRLVAEKYTPYRKCIFISITTPFSEPAKIEKSELCLDVLRLSFNDVEKQDETEAIKFILFTEDMARKIIEFVRYYLKEVEEILIHCEAGQSRSVGCAAAIAKCFYGDDTEFFKETTPNMLVYSTIVRVYNEEK